MKIATLSIVLVSAAISAFVFVANADWHSGGLFLFAMFPWTLFPHLIAAFCSRTRRNLIGGIFLLLASMSCAAAAIIYIDGFYIHRDAQNGLLFLFIPIYQILLVGSFCAAAAITSPRLKAGRGAATGP